MSVTLRRAVKEAVQVQPDAGMDDQGLPGFGAAIEVHARVVRGDEVVRLANGSEVKTFVTLWLEADEPYLPDTDDRLVLLDGTVGIVVERTDGKTLQDVLDHVRVKIREE